MATRTLVDGSTDLTLTASWSGATVPVTGDDAVIPRGTQTINTFNLAGVRLENLLISFGGTIQSSAGAPLLVDVDNSADALAKITGQDIRAWFGGGSTNAKWENLHVRSPGSVLYFTTGEYEDTIIEAGKAVFDSNAVIDNLDVYGGEVELGAETSGITVYQDGGRVVANRPGTYEVVSGTLVFDNTAGGTTEIKVRKGAKLLHVNGAIQTADISGEYFDHLEEEATIGGTSAKIRPGARFVGLSDRATFSNVTQVGVSRAPGMVGI